MKLLLIPLILLTLSIGCKKNSNNNPTAEIDKLPAITQTGVNTFGCLINGVAFTPSVPMLLGKKTLKCYYDPTFENGAINLSAENIINSNKSILIAINTFGINDIGSFSSSYYYSVNIPKRVILTYDNTINICSFSSSTPPPPSLDTGLLEITKFDKTTSIISGKFQFTFYTTACDTMKITDGRFDIKYN